MKRDLQRQQRALAVALDARNGAEADPLQDQIGDQGHHMADLGRGRQDGEHQAGAILAAGQPLFVADVGHHGAQQEQAGGVGAGRR